MVVVVEKRPSRSLYPSPASASSSLPLENAKLLSVCNRAADARPWLTTVRLGEGRLVSVCSSFCLLGLFLLSFCARLPHIWNPAFWVTGVSTLSFSGRSRLLLTASPSMIEVFY